MNIVLVSAQIRYGSLTSQSHAISLSSESKSIGCSAQTISCSFEVIE